MLVFMPFSWKLVPMGNSLSKSFFNVFIKFYAIQIAILVMQDMALINRCNFINKFLDISLTKNSHSWPLVILPSALDLQKQNYEKMVSNVIEQYTSINWGSHLITW